MNDKERHLCPSPRSKSTFIHHHPPETILSGAYKWARGRSSTGPSGIRLLQEISNVPSEGKVSKRWELIRPLSGGSFCD